MRLWSIHPKYLDRLGLLALWREALLAQAVLLGKTHGYRNHPQLLRFKAEPSPIDAIGAYLFVIYEEASKRGYRFNSTKIHPWKRPRPILVTSGQIRYEWHHLLFKLSTRDPIRFNAFDNISTPDPHPCFQICQGALEAWEKGVTEPSIPKR